MCQKNEVGALQKLRIKPHGCPFKKAGWYARGTCIVLRNYKQYYSKGRWLAGRDMYIV